jgi:hypothetical protein
LILPKQRFLALAVSENARPARPKRPLPSFTVCRRGQSKNDHAERLSFTALLLQGRFEAALGAAGSGCVRDYPLARCSSVCLGEANLVSTGLATRN